MAHRRRSALTRKRSARAISFSNGSNRAQPGHTETRRRTRSANASHIIEPRGSSQRCRLFDCRYCEGHVADGGYQRLQSHRSDLLRVATRLRRDAIAGANGVRRRGASCGRARDDGYRRRVSARMKVNANPFCLKSVSFTPGFSPVVDGTHQQKTVSTVY